MRTIARINADGSLLIRGEVYELVSAWEDTDDIDDTFTIDEETEIDEELPFEDLIEILLGIKSQAVSPDGIYFDSVGNFFVNELLETLQSGISFHEDNTVEVKEIQEGVDLD